MATSKIFKKVPITVPSRSGFNMSHNRFFSAPVGTLVPSMVDFLIPGDEVDLSSKLHIQLPPMATDFYGRIQAREEAFFVPCRILFGGWKDFFVNPLDNTTNPSNIEGQLAKYLIGAASGEEIFPLSVKLFEDNTTGSTYYDTVVGPNFAFEQDQNYQIAQINLDGSISFLGYAYIDWYNKYTQAIANDSNIYTVSSMLNTIRQSRLGNAFYNFVTKLQTAIDNHDFDFFFPERPTVFSHSIGAGSLADYLGFKVQGLNSDLTDEALLLKMQEIHDYMYNIYIDQTFGSGQNNLAEFFYILAASGDYRSNVISGLLLTDDNDESITDIIAIKPADIQNSGSVYINNILPFMAYHKVYDDWYRNPQLQQSLFKRNVANQSTATSVANMPWITSGADDKIYFNGEQLNFANGHNLFELHQRNWEKDYFTSATPEPQAGEASTVKFDVVDDSGEFTIASLRSANALQQWLDRNNIGGFRYGDFTYAQYGVYPSDAITDRAIYLGSTSVDVYNKSVYQQSGDGGTDTNNPFNAIGSKYSNPTGVGDGSFCNNYRVTEAGFIIKIFSLVPSAYYSTGVRKMFTYNDISDIAFPVLAGVGDQEIKGRELVDVYNQQGDDTTFGYVQRYSEYKFIDDSVHGLLRDGQSLDSFALQRSFADVPQLGTDFIEIPRDYLDQVSATSYKLSQYGCWVNCYNSYKKSSTLPAYSIPTLEDMKGRTVLVDKGGSML